MRAWPAVGDAGGGGYGLAPGQQVDAAVLRQLVDALDDGVALTGADGTIVLANRKLAAMFGYQAADLAGRSVEVLVPGGLREAHRRHRAAYQRRPSARPMADRARLAGVAWLAGSPGPDGCGNEPVVGGWLPQPSPRASALGPDGGPLAAAGDEVVAEAAHGGGSRARERRVVSHPRLFDTDAARASGQRGREFACERSG